MFRRLLVSFVIGTTVAFGSLAHEFGEQHCTESSFWDSTDWTLVAPDDEIVKILKHCVLAHKTKSHYALHSITKSKNTQLMQLLIDYGAELNPGNGQSMGPLHWAVDKRFSKGMDILIGNGANINARTGIGETPLHYAVKNNDLITTGKLISLGANVNSISKKLHLRREECERVRGKEERFGFSPLHIAAACGYNGILHLLVESGSNIDKCSKSEGTPLQIATINGHADIVEILIDAGAQVNAVMGEAGLTPLYFVAYREGRSYYTSDSDAKICKLLVEAGANIHATWVRWTGETFDSPIEATKRDVARYAERPCYLAMTQNGQIKIAPMFIKPSLDCYELNQSKIEDSND